MLMIALAIIIIIVFAQVFGANWIGYFLILIDWFFHLPWLVAILVIAFSVIAVAILRLVIKKLLDKKT